MSVADPGFPIGGGVELGRWGHGPPEGAYVLKILHVKMIESRTHRGGHAPGTPPRSANECAQNIKVNLIAKSTYGVRPSYSCWLLKM